MKILSIHDLQIIRKRAEHNLSLREESNEKVSEKCCGLASGTKHLQILICGGTGCKASSSQGIMENLQKAIERNGITDKVDVITVGCFGFCEKGPIVKIIPDNTFYTQVTPEDAEAIINEQKHLGLVHRLKSDGFSDTEMCNWTFANDNGRNPQMKHAHRYVDKWAEVRTKNIGLLLWGGVGTGKSFFAGCIANALMEQEVSVRMTNFASILNDLSNSFSGRNDMVDRLCSYPLLIIDDFGIERGTEYALEQVYNIIDARYRSKKPLIVTTNLTLTDLKNPQDVAHARIYDRLRSMCSPICFAGENLRQQAAAQKTANMRALMKSTT